MRTTLFVLLLAGTAHAAWVQQFQDTFARSNSSTVGNSWTDAAGIYSISSSTLAWSTNNANGYTANFLTRPSGESAQDQRAVAQWTVTNVASSPAVILRHQSGKSNYVCNPAPMSTGTGKFFAAIYYISGGGSVSTLWSDNSSYSYTLTDTYRADCSATGTNPTTIALTVTDVTTSTTVFTHSVTDSTSDVQNSTGVTGLLMWAASGTASGTVTSFTVYTNVTTSIAISPASYTGTGSVTIAVTGTGTAFAGSPFTAAGIPSASITSQTVSSGTSASVTIAVGSYAGFITITDSGSSTSAVLQVYHPPKRALKIGYVGDSITQGTNGDPVGAMGSYLQTLGYTVTQVNQAVVGTTTGNWAGSTGGANLSATISAFTSAGVQYVCLMLGTNDARTPYQYSASAHFGYMTTVINALTAAGFVVVLHQPIWSVEGSSFSGVTWPAGVNVVYQQYWAADQALVNGASVVAGDTGGFDWFETNPSHLQDGVHPTSGGNTELGQIWALAFLRAARLTGGVGSFPIQ